MSDMRMNCDEVFARLHDYLDRELTPAEIEDVKAHLGLCSECAEEFFFEESVLRYVKRCVEATPVPAELQKRCFEALREVE
jgi:anti-sigma factor (TIGR02949 family)